MRSLVEKVEEAIRRGELLAPGNRVAVACSGGADSVALVRLLVELKDRLGLRLLVVHLNHQLRGAEADADEAFVRRLAERLELEFLVKREDVAARALKQKSNMEEAGRQARQEFFASLIRNGKADVVALGHTMDDQAETVLGRILRGAGTKGLAGIYPVVEEAGSPTGGSQWAEREKPEKSGPAQRGSSGLRGASQLRLVRPLLGVRRAALRDYLAEHEQVWREDTSNLDRKRLRNQIRLELLSQLNPAAIEHLARLAEHARQEESFWAAYTEERFRALVPKLRDDEVELAVAALLEPAPWRRPLPRRTAEEAQRAVARRLLRRTLAAVRGDLRRITQTHVESVLRLAAQGQSGQRVELPGVDVERRFQQLVFRPASARARSRPAAAPDYQVQVEAPGCVRLPGGRALSFKLVGVEELEPGYNKSREVADAARVPFPLRVRNWQPGDSYQPAGYPGPKKLKLLFQQERIPVGERAGMPVVLCGEEIVWVPRFGVAASVGLSSRSRKALLIEERAEG